MCISIQLLHGFYEGVTVCECGWVRDRIHRSGLGLGLTWVIRLELGLTMKTMALSL